MKRILCPKIPKPGSSIEIPEAEARHAVQVMRLSNGDEVEILDGQGNHARAVLEVRGKSVWAKAIEASSAKDGVPDGEQQVLPIHLALAVLKGEAMEWVVEKCVELSVARLTPLITDHAVVQVGKKGPEHFQERWQKIADQALKQCGRLTRMPVDLPVKLQDFMATHRSGSMLWLDESVRQTQPGILQAIPQGQNEQILLIGPEGGWSERERDLLSRSPTRACSLGPLVLRAETAAISSVSLIAGQLRWNKT